MGKKGRERGVNRRLCFQFFKFFIDTIRFNKTQLAF